MNTYFDHFLRISFKLYQHIANPAAKIFQRLEMVEIWTLLVKVQPKSWS